MSIETIKNNKLILAIAIKLNLEEKIISITSECVMNGFDSAYTYSYIHK